MNGLDQEGIFRLSGKLITIEWYRDLFDVGEVPVLDEIEDPNIVSGLLKLYLKEMPEPILTFGLYSRLISIAEKRISKEEKFKEVLELICTELPDLNFTVMKFLLGFLRRVSQLSDINKMTLSNLSTVFGPNLLRPEHDLRPLDLVRHTPLVNEITQILIEFEKDIIDQKPKTQYIKQQINFDQPKTNPIYNIDQSISIGVRGSQGRGSAPRNFVVFQNNNQEEKKSP